ncbi:MAG TPA: hypothetical protein VFA33_01120 [Bryobacteraceae bacterium]|nr:hypothetical protein [Bryobacteraceae bacterium]
MKVVHVVLMAGCCLWPAQGAGIRIYDSARDDAAQKAAAAAAKVASGSLFDAEMKNLDAFAKQEFDSVFAGEARNRDGVLNTVATGTWSNVRTSIQGLEGQLKLDLSTIENRIKELQAEVQALQAQKGQIESQKPPPGPAVPGNPAEAVAALAGQGIDADKAAAALAGAFKKSDSTGGQAISLLGKALAEAKTAADTTSANQKAVSDQVKQLDQLRASLNSLAADRIKLELDHAQTLLKIWEKARAETQDTQKKVETYLKGADGMNQGEMILETLRSRAAAVRNAPPEELKTKENDLDRAVQLPFLAVAIGARWNSAPLVARLREAHEYHRYSIQRSRLEAHAYEVAVGAGAQRLAMFYKGGVRPETIAQILYTAATASISGTIAATK